MFSIDQRIVLFDNKILATIKSEHIHKPLYISYPKRITTSILLQLFPKEANKPKTYLKRKFYKILKESTRNWERDWQRHREVEKKMLRRKRQLQRKQSFIGSLAVLLLSSPLWILMLPSLINMTTSSTPYVIKGLTKTTSSVNRTWVRGHWRNLPK